MSEVAIIILVAIAAFTVLILSRKQDNTTSEEIIEATQHLIEEINKAEDVVGTRAPHSQDCREQLELARYCLLYSGRNQRLVVSRWMVKQKRLEGIEHARLAVELALKSKAE